MFYNHPDVAEAYLGKTPLTEPVHPRPDSKPVYWLYYEFWKLPQIRSAERLKMWVTTILQGKEGIFSGKDPLPFLMVNHWHIPLLLLSNLKRLKGWRWIDFNLGELVGEGED